MIGGMLPGRRVAFAIGWVGFALVAAARAQAQPTPVADVPLV